tara:strand:- start:642 stop:1049 length:408 start_codon:yes stop_codon:yes gene_type:complete
MPELSYYVQEVICETDTATFITEEEVHPQVLNEILYRFCPFQSHTMDSAYCVDADTLPDLFEAFEDHSIASGMDDEDYQKVLNGERNLVGFWGWGKRIEIDLTEALLNLLKKTTPEEREVLGTHNEKFWDLCTGK